MTDALTVPTPALDHQRPDPPHDLLPSQACPSAFAADLPAGVRSILRMIGSPGLASFGGTARSRADREAFRMTLAVSRFGLLDACRAHHTAVVVPRPGDNFGRSQRAVRLVIVLDGEATLSAGGRTARIGPGGGALVHGWDDYVYESTADVTRVHVDVAADEAPFAAALSKVPPMVWTADTPVLRAAGAALSEVVRRDDGIDAAHRDALQRMAQSVLLSVLAAPPGGGVPAPASQRLRAQVLEHIAAHHADCALTPGRVAANLGLSTRSLQRLFEGEKNGVADHITAARLEHALALLRDPLLAGATMEEVAARSGFGSVSRMRRAVRLATGLCPTSLRAQHAGGMIPAASLS